MKQEKIIISVTKPKLDGLLEALSTVPTLPDGDHICDAELARYVEAALIPAEMDRIERHLQSCEACVDRAVFVSEEPYGGFCDPNLRNTFAEVVADLRDALQSWWQSAVSTYQGAVSQIHGPSLRPLKCESPLKVSRETSGDKLYIFRLESLENGDVIFAVQTKDPRITHTQKSLALHFGGVPGKLILPMDAIIEGKVSLGSKRILSKDIKNLLELLKEPPELGPRPPVQDEPA